MGWRLLRTLLSKPSLQMDMDCFVLVSFSVFLYSSFLQHSRRDCKSGVSAGPQRGRSYGEILRQEVNEEKKNDYPKQCKTLVGGSLGNDICPSCSGPNLPQGTWVNGLSHL